MFTKESSNGDRNDTKPASSLASTTKYHEFGQKLSLRTKLFYSFGHVYNDLCASIWFSYTLLYFKLSFDDTTAGLLLLLGQVADAISTPLIGYGSDKNISLFGQYGRRKIWHLIGTVFVTASFPFIFNSCVLCSNTSQWEKFFYYSIFISLFQFGWAAVQVAHLSLITDLSDLSSERVELNSYRQAATVASSICVYTVTLVFLGVEDTTISKNDSIVFMKVVHLITLIGIIFSIMFHIFIKEPSMKEILELSDVETGANPPQSSQSNKSCTKSLSLDSQLQPPNTTDPTLIDGEANLTKSQKPSKMKREHKMRIWSDWLKSISFWKICLIYMMSRLYVNITQVYTPLYLQETLQLAKRNIAIVPFITYFAGFIFSLVGKSKRINSRSIMCFGCFFSFLSCLWIWFSYLDISIWEVFTMGAIFGVGGTLMLIGSLSLTADLINENKISGAFVYGLMSFFDKLVNGAVIALVQHLKPVNEVDHSFNTTTTTTTFVTYENVTTDSIESTTTNLDHMTTTNFLSFLDNDDQSVFYLYVLVFVSGAAVIFTFLSLISIMQKEISKIYTFLKQCFV